MKVKRLAKPEKTWAGRDQYANALTKSDVKNRKVELSYTDIEIEEGVTKTLYFKDIPADLGIKLRDPGTSDEKRLELMFQLIGDMVVDPTSGKPIMSSDEWAHEDIGFLNKVMGAVLGIQIIPESEDEGQSGDEPTKEAIDALNEAAADPNP